MDRALFHIDNAYHWQNVRVKGYVCTTNSQSNTAFRGFGGPQAMLISEHIMEHLAWSLSRQLVNSVPKQTLFSSQTKASLELRRRNLYRKGDRTHYGQEVLHCDLNRMWNTLTETADVKNRQAEVINFNKENKWRKRGIAMIPTKFGISFTATFMNQAGALVHVYTDGSVLVTHGGTEMGQGLHTKMCQVAARAFNISIESVTVTETATDKVPNSSPTAASASSDLYGMAVLNACEQINARLAPVRLKLKAENKFGEEPKFSAVASAAYYQRINLSAQGFYKTPGIGYDFEMETTCNSERGKPFRYFTSGVACAEVELDILSGDSQVLRADILLDLGKSLNPALDIGQIEGAWAQGIGLFMLEELTWGDNDHPWVRRGQLFTRGPGTYKIPAANDTPHKFNVTLLSDSGNPTAVHGSKAVGEPPLFLASSAFFAARAAVESARQSSTSFNFNSGKMSDGSSASSSKFFPLDSPASSERLRMSCIDELRNRCVNEDIDSFRPRGSW